MKKTLKRLITSIFILLIAITLGFLGWASFPLGPENAALASLQSDDSVTVQTSSDWITFRPAASDPVSGFIFYPGGRVDYRSYAPLLKPLAERGYLVVLVRMPLSLAVFSPNKAEIVIGSFPEIQNWAIGGHSLGGAMAANFCYNHPGVIDGLVLWASYPADSNSLANQSLKVLSIYGSEDGGLDGIEASAPLLPADTIWYRIEGGNHAQFGDYGPQPGDGIATINPEEQQNQIMSTTQEFLTMIFGD
jgi:hypothetical protein